MSLKSLQAKIGITADGAWGPGTFKAAMAYYKFTPVRAAHFFAQTAHETGGYKAFGENLNYNAAGLMGIFKKYFPDMATANRYARQLIVMLDSQKRLLIVYMQVAWVTVQKVVVMVGDIVVVEHYN
jgi:hypothetical protein